MYKTALDIYRDSKAAGFSDNDAMQIAVNSDTLYNAFKSEFATNKFVTIMGSLIITAISFLGVEVWSLSIDMKTVIHRLTSIEEQLKQR